MLTVERRLRLALYRGGGLDADQLQALTEDNAAQEAVWEGLPAYDRDAWSLRRILT